MEEKLLQSEQTPLQKYGGTPFPPLPISYSRIRQSVRTKVRGPLQRWRALLRRARNPKLQAHEGPTRERPCCFSATAAPWGVDESGTHLHSR